MLGRLKGFYCDKLLALTQQNLAGVRTNITDLQRLKAPLAAISDRKATTPTGMPGRRSFGARGPVKLEPPALHASLRDGSLQSSLPPERAWALRTADIAAARSAAGPVPQKWRK